MSSSIVDIIKELSPSIIGIGSLLVAIVSIRNNNRNFIVQIKKKNSLSWLELFRSDLVLLLEYGDNYLRKVMNNEIVSSNQINEGVFKRDPDQQKLISQITRLQLLIINEFGDDNNNLERILGKYYELINNIDKSALIKENDDILNEIVTQIKEIIRQVQVKI